jgi:hypothetical protein
VLPRTQFQIDPAKLIVDFKDCPSNNVGNIILVHSKYFSEVEKFGGDQRNQRV